MKNIIAVILLACLSIFGEGFTIKLPSPNEIIGFYWSPKKDAKIEIYLKNGHYFGKFVWAATPRKDIKNPNKLLRNRDIVGLEFLTKFTYEDAVYTGGEIYDPETGKTYSCKMNLNGSKLKVRGYMGISLFGRTEYFERIK